jgi:hypothetical protein
MQMGSDGGTPDRRYGRASLSDGSKNAPPAANASTCWQPGVPENGQVVICRLPWHQLAAALATRLRVPALLPLLPHCPPQCREKTVLPSHLAARHSAVRRQYCLPTCSHGACSLGGCEQGGGHWEHWATEQLRQHISAARPAPDPARHQPGGHHELFPLNARLARATTRTNR